jgi:hypothetical protein
MSLKREPDRPTSLLSVLHAFVEVTQQPNMSLAMIYSACYIIS